jgi:LysM repeat protein
MGVSKTGGTGGASHNHSVGSSNKVGGGATKASYTVKPGDTFSQISQKLGKNVNGLMANNPQIKNPNKISVGDKINISGGVKTPGAKNYTVQWGDSLSKIAQKHNTTVGNLLRANPNAVNPRNLVYPGQKLNLPTAGKMTNSSVPVAPTKTTKNSKAVNTQLPPKGVGYTTYYSQNRKFGTPATIQKLQELAKQWNAKNPNFPIQIGDISIKGGGKISDHVSHRKGIDVDIRPFSKSGVPGALTIHNKNYNAAKTKEFVKMLKQNYPNTMVLFNDPALTKSGLTKYWDNHNNHMHLRFY